MKKKLETLCIVTTIFFFSMLAPQIKAQATDEVNKELKIINYIKKSERTSTPKVDHSQFKILQQDFENAHKLTAACLSCHNGRHTEILESSHFKWYRTEKIGERGEVELGKKNVINNFCIGISGSEKTCTRCHIGYGWEDKNFDFNEPTNIDCLICHDQTGTYKKASGKAGYPEETVDLSYVASSVGSPKRENCGVCHYWGGGGNNVKHGDLDKAMNNCSRDVDVHMTIDGEDMSCIDCHTTENHDIPGQVYSVSSINENRNTCVQCHTQTPHKTNILNNHQNRIACQTCHIPIYAKANPTKMYWDWSTTGKMGDDGKRLIEPDAYGGHKYYSHKGTFVYRKNVVPEYYWFNGTAEHTLIEDTFDDTKTLQINTLNGSFNDGMSKIWPVKVHRGKQPYDTKFKTLIQPKLWDTEQGKGAYWLDYNWDESAKKGMEYIERPYSGELGYIKTEMYWPLNHQVSSADKALTCTQCHTNSKDGRLANLKGGYIPGRDSIASIEYFGFGMVLLSLIGVFIHALIRIFYNKK